MSRFRGSKTAKEPIPEVEADLLRNHPSSGSHCLAALEKELTDSGCTGSVEVAIFTAKNWGGRHENEDRTITTSETFKNMRFYTIGALDGHDTEIASDAVSQMLPRVLAKHLQEGKAIEEAYTVTMAEVEEALKKVCATAGTCVCSNTVIGRHVWCANLGDCRSVLIPLQVPESATSPTKCTGLIWMSRDHKASCPDEKRRIQKAGGTVMDGRVEGLEPSRTLGDFDVKLQVKPDVISIVPEVRYRAIAEGPTPAQAILVSATDGVWDVISGQDICDLIHARKELAALQSAMIGAGGKVGSHTLKDLSEDLVQFAIARGSRDDCTAVSALISFAPQ